MVGAPKTKIFLSAISKIMLQPINMLKEYTLKDLFGCSKELKRAVKITVSANGNENREKAPWKTGLNPPYSTGFRLLKFILGVDKHMDKIIVKMIIGIRNSAHRPNTSIPLFTI